MRIQSNRIQTALEIEIDATRSIEVPVPGIRNIQSGADNGADNDNDNDDDDHHHAGDEILFQPRKPNLSLSTQLAQ